MPKKFTPLHPQVPIKAVRELLRHIAGEEVSLESARARALEGLRALQIEPRTLRNIRPIFPSAARAALFALVITAVVGVPRVSGAESPADAIARIRRGAHAQMPPPETTYTSGPAGKGMSIENGTGHLLRLHFRGPVNRTVDVPDGQSAAVELVVGTYEVAAEVPGASIMPFYGTQTYQPYTHYWLKFFIQTQYR